MIDKKKRSRIINAAVVCVLALLCVAEIFIIASYTASFEHENAAKRFSNGTRYAQITVLLPESADFTVDKIMYFRYNLEKALVEKAITSGSENGRLYADAYSAVENASIRSESARSTSARVTYIGGDYELFHDEFRTLPKIEKDVNHDRVLLSRSAAWQLYGGTELYDLPVTIGEDSLLVGGVYDDYKGKAYEEYYGDLTSVTADIHRDPDRAVTCYELLLVNPVTDFAKNMVKDCLEVEDGTCVIIENSARFSALENIKRIPRLLSADETLPTGVDLTPEEMMARRGEKVASALTALLLVTAIYPAIWFFILLLRLIKLIKKLADRLIIGKIKDKLSYS